ncbi:hypothetical protein ACFS32_22680 [Novosphingobium pokkalii]|uniref:hypothetical protein n=1 Tax=Novosphingobium pokkalii TaxID=1770194 RepID=UPI0036308777
MAQAHGLMPRDMVAGTQAVDPAEAAKFASLPLELEADELLVLVEGILARGVSVDPCSSISWRHRPAAWASIGKTTTAISWT